MDRLGNAAEGGRHGVHLAHWWPGQRRDPRGN